MVDWHPARGAAPFPAHSLSPSVVCGGAGSATTRDLRVRDLQTWITALPEYGAQRLIASLFGVFSALARALAAFGLYSVVSYGVATRTNEFGIRMALGARSADVFRMVLTSTAVNVGVGIAAGLLLCIAFGKFATKWILESSRDPLILAGATFVLVAVAALACLVPARRAAAVDPMEALRYEQQIAESIIS